MKILLINKYHYLKGGAERLYFDMAQMLEERGHQVAFFSMQHPENRKTIWEKYFIGNAEYQEGKISIGKIFFNFEAKRNLEKLLDDFHPDIVHVHNIYHQLSPSIFWSLRKRHIPIVMTLHDYKLISPNYSLFVRGKIWEHTSGFRCIVDRCVKNSISKSIVCAMEKWLHILLRSYEKVDVFIAPSKFLIEKFKEFGFKRDIVYLPNPIITSEKEIVGREREEDTFLFFGRLSPEKGVELLFEAFTLLPSKKLWIVGDGPDRKRLELLVEEKGMTERVKFFGALYDDDLGSLKSRAQAIIIPSLWYENFPYVLIESLQAGAVVIVADRGGISERIQHGENGLLFDPSSTQSLVESIRSLDTRPLDTMRARAKESVADLSEENFVSHLMGIYEDLLSKR
jgi:glycosyltransferase involved in cell wall biosynthesis